MASKRKQHTGWPIFLFITTIVAHFSWLLRLGFVTRGIALWHGTLPLFDATKCRLCLRRLLRDFLSTLDVVLKCRSEVEQKRNGIANSFSPFFLSSSRAQFPHFVRWQGAFQIGLGCINNKRSNSFFFSESNREIPSPKQRPYSCKEATDLNPRL